MPTDTLDMIAKRYQDEGYAVIVHPRGDQVPPFAADFRLDLIATRGREGVIAEVKSNRIDLSSDPQITRMAEVINAQPGWRFDVVVLEPVTPIERAAVGASEPTDDQLAEMLGNAEEMTDRGYLHPACVLAWAGLEAAMRRLRDDAELYGGTMPAELMRTLYSNGFLTRDQFDMLKESYKLRSQIVHGLVPSNFDPNLVRFVTATARYLVASDEVALPST